MKKIPDLGFWKLWNISFGFFGVQIAYRAAVNISDVIILDNYLDHPFQF